MENGAFRHLIKREYLKLLLPAAILLLAFAVRWGQIDLRLLHTDEAVQALQSAKLINGEGYRYDPADKHGPFLYYATQAVARVAGWSSDLLTTPRLRLIPLISGIALLVLVAGQGRHFGPRRMLLALLLMAIAPMAVLYQTYYVQEAWFAFFTWALLITCYHQAIKPSLAKGLLIGVLAGLMQSCKETSILHFGALGIALLCSGLWRVFRAHGKQQIQDWSMVLALLSGFGLYTLFYTSFGANPSGFLDGIVSYVGYSQKAVSSPHVQSARAYLDVVMPHRSQGIFWSELMLLPFASYGFLRSLKSHKSQLVRLSSWFTFLLLLIYVVIPYKTPWLLLTPYLGLCIIAASGAVDLWDLSRRSMPRLIIAAAFLACVGELSWRCHQALYRYPGDSRVPYFYQQTSPDFSNLLTFLEKEQKAMPEHPLCIAVCSPDHAWPLPWYLRDKASIGYFSKLEATEIYDLVLLDSRLSEQGSKALANREEIATFGLRPNVLLHVLRRRQP